MYESLGASTQGAQNRNTEVRSLPLRWTGCGDGRAWLLKTKAFTYECAACGRQTSVTAETIMHASKLPLTTWFWAAFLVSRYI